MNTTTEIRTETELEKRVKKIIEGLSYKPCTGFHMTQRDGVVLVNHWQLLQCSTSRAYSRQNGRKFYISPHMTDEEIIRTFALAVKVFEEHEANEWLRYRNKKVLNPHPEGMRPDIRT